MSAGVNDVLAVVDSTSEITSIAKGGARGLMSNWNIMLPVEIARADGDAGDASR